MMYGEGTLLVHTLRDYYFSDTEHAPALARISAMGIAPSLKLGVVYETSSTDSEEAVKILSETSLNVKSLWANTHLPDQAAVNV
ncbi:hypothetical protein Tco_1003546 [Tanacetum coccineum]|uniref:Uncharacterized protein n=1 Tax=Tanacetum coccineum TaxID=301880 RepID=A0ABQ5F9D2_9ASTR